MQLTEDEIIRLGQRLKDLQRMDTIRTTVLARNKEANGSFKYEGNDRKTGQVIESINAEILYRYIEEGLARDIGIATSELSQFDFVKLKDRV